MVTDDMPGSSGDGLPPGEQPRHLPGPLQPVQRDLSDEEFFGFIVDAGDGCFSDAVAVPALVRIFADDTWDDTGYGWRVLVDMFGDNVTGELSDPDSGASPIAFHTGGGDGCYSTWIGRSASGDIACFAAGFSRIPGDNPVPDPGTTLIDGQGHPR